MKPIEEYVTSIPDFPEEGIIFRDVTSVLQDAPCSGSDAGETGRDRF